jgi:hypothetical protein
MNEIEHIYKNRKPDGHFFDPQAKRFFRSRVGAVIEYNREGPIYFLTSEQFVDSRGNKAPRKYTARVMGADGRIESIGPFNVFSRAQAVRQCKLAASLKITADEASAGGLALKTVLEAKEAWEAAGGALTAEVEHLRRCADTWAGNAGWRFSWDSITPGVHRGEQELAFGQLVFLAD